MNGKTSHNHDWEGLTWVKMARPSKLFRLTESSTEFQLFLYRNQQADPCWKLPGKSKDSK